MSTNVFSAQSRSVYAIGIVCIVSFFTPLYVSRTLLAPPSSSSSSSAITNAAFLEAKPPARWARIYRQWSNSNNNTTYDWCVEENRTSADGIYYAKLPKSASSTLTGIALRLAHNIPSRTTDTPHRVYGPCQAFVEHGKPLSFQEQERVRNKSRSILWTLVRHPRKRAMSHVFFSDVSRRSIKPTDKFMLQQLPRYKSYTTNFMITSKGFRSVTHNTTEALETMDLIFDHYDFIGIVERTHESLVVLKMLYHLDFGDLLYVSSKVTGGYDDGQTNAGCVKIQQAFESPAVKAYLDSKNWTTDNWDYPVYKAANKSLDMTIDSLGREKVEEQVRQYRDILKRAQEDCNDKAFFPCSATGERQVRPSMRSCYRRDYGCGYACLDAFWSREKRNMTIS